MTTAARARRRTLGVPLLSGLAAAALVACGGASDRVAPEPGVSRALAVARKATVTDLRYAVHLELPAIRDSAVRGRVEATFAWAGAGDDLVLDFRAPATNVGVVTVDGDTIVPTLVPDHIVIPARAVPAGRHAIAVEFTSTDAALNRNDEFLYALFVPDRASTAIPVFEQPDLKARVTLTLGVPADWEAVANGALVSRDSAAAPGRHRLSFAETAPLPTYLVSFAAGKLRKVTAERGGRTFTMYHRETDAARVARNADAIFDLHAASIAWLEAYTAIPYPFAKFDFFAVPAFQFGGMEHPGAVWYRADALFLDESPARTQELGRASLIAHETAHMWFGDLVTMAWFDDVWMKEVFANFMAARIVAPAFPDVDHALRFFQAHHAAAYGVDRTAGANAIRQELANLRDAGSLYGAIIYQKAPVVMRQLEALVGDTTFRDGLRQYLAEHRFGNATWPDLVAVLDARSPRDVRAWSRVWVEESGRPTVQAEWVGRALVLRQRDTWSALVRPYAAPPAPGAPTPPERRLRWPQRITTLIAWGDSVRLVTGDLAGDSVAIAVDDAPAGEPDLVLPGVDGTSYARFPLGGPTRLALASRAASLATPLQRAVAWQGLYEEMIDDLLAPRALLAAALEALPAERDELVASQLTGLIRGTYWRYLTDSARLALAPEVERVLWAALESAPTAGRKGALFGAIIAVTLTDAGVARLERIWRKRETPRGFPVSEGQYIALAEGLALRGVRGADAILEEQESRITNPDRRARQRFMRAALSADSTRRDSLFRSFARVEARRRESWVLDAMGAMNHPLRARAFLPSLDAALALTGEIQRTGDIFFPLNWLNATLGGHNSDAAAGIVRAHLAAHPEMDARVRGKMLQASDDLFRASQVLARRDGGRVP